MQGELQSHFAILIADIRNRFADRFFCISLLTLRVSRSSHAVTPAIAAQSLTGVWVYGIYSNYRTFNMIRPRLLFTVTTLSVFSILVGAGPVLAQSSAVVRNFSSRAYVGVGESAVVVGFIVSGTSQDIVLRAIGPSLAVFGIDQPLTDPILELHDSTGGVIATNNDWQDTQAARFSEGGADYKFAPANKSESAIAITLPSGAYTAVVRGNDGGSGIAVTEIYSTSERSDSTISNISSRAFVGTGENVMISSVIVDGSGTVDLLMQALGPSLDGFDVTAPLADPSIALYDGNGALLSTNNDWQDDPVQAAAIARAAVAIPRPTESAMVVALPPGAYTAVVSGNQNTSGVALFEAYQLSTLTSEDSMTSRPSVPHGVFDLVGAGGKIDAAALTNAAVDGISLRQHWVDLEPREGVFSFDYLDGEIARAEKAGKKVSIRVPTGGDEMPAWVLAAVRNAGGSTFTFTDSDGQHTIPAFWDPTFLAKKNAVMAALGARYRNRPAVKVVVASFANATTADWNVPHGTTADAGYGTSEVTRWRKAGYTTQKMINAGKSIIDAAMKAFPNQVIYLAINTNGGLLDEPYHDNYVAEKVIANARALWGTTRLVVAKNSLKTNTQPPVPDPYTALAVWYSSRAASAAQTNWRAYDDPKYRINDGIRRDPAMSLRQSVDIGIAYGISYIELYEADIVNLPAIVDYAHAKL